MTPEEEAKRWPEHHKLKRVSEESERNAIGSFLEWLGEQGVYLARLDPKYGADLVPYYERPISRWIAEYYGIDYEKYEAEKDDMLAYVRDFYANEDK